jgi:microcystin degradation protein MlrC
VAPVVLVDIGDNVGGGSPADSTIVLAELLAQKAQGWAMALYEPAGVQAAAAAGVSRAVSLRAGQPAVVVQGRVRALHEGTFVEPEIRHGGARYNDQGLSALIEVGGPNPDSPNLLLLTSKRMPPFSLQQLISVGIAPERQKILVVKAAVAFRAAYEPVARRIIEVNTPGITAADPRVFSYEHVRRPIFPLDEL